MNNSKFDRGIVLGLAGVVALLIVNAVLSYRNVRQLNADADWVVHTHEVMDALEAVHGHLREAEAVERTYLITGGDQPAAFAQSINAVRQAVGQVKLLTQDNPDQKARLPDIEKGIDELQAEWSRTMSIRQAQGFDAARQIVQRGDNDKVMARLLTLLLQMDDAERLLLRDRQVKTDRTYSTAVVTGIVTAVLGLVAVAMFIWLLELHLRTQQRAATMIHEQGQLLHATLSSVGDAVIATDIDGLVTFLNPAAQTLTGWSTEDAAGVPLEKVFHIVNEATRRPVESPALRALQEGVIVGLANHTVLIARDGTERPIDDSAAPIRNRNGDVAGVVLVFRDITERRREEAGQAERNRLIALRADVSTALASTEPTPTALRQCCEALVRQLDVAFARIWTLNDSGNVLELQASAGMYTHLDGPHSRVPVGQYKIGRIASTRQPHLTNAVPDDPNVSDREWARREGMVAFAGYPLVVEKRLVGVVAMFARHPLTEGVLTELAPLTEGIAQFIDRRQGEERFRQQAELHRVTLASIGDAVLATDAAGRVTFLNDVAANLIGWSPDEAVGQPVEAVFHIVNESTGEPVENPVCQVLREGVVVGLALRAVLIARDGTRRPIDDSGSPIRAGTKIVGVVLVFRDVTEKRVQEFALRASEERLHLAVNAAGLGLWDWDVRTAEVIWNTHHERIFGYTPGQPKRTYRDFADRILPEDLQRIEDGFRRAMQERREYRFEHRVVWSDGSTRWVEAIGKFHFDATGQAVRSVGVLLDMTERKQAEDALREADRRKDEFLAMLAHELRNPLAPLRNGLQVLRMASGNWDAIEQARTMMDRQLLQLVRLVDDLMDVSRISRGKIELRREQVPLSAVVNSAIETSRPVIEQMGHELTVTLPKEPVVVDADLTRLAQVFLNLLNNAAKYTERGGQIWLTAERQGSDVVVCVKDNGIGIAPDQVPRLFEMFAQLDRSLERSQGGLGIGLTLVKRLVEMHGGRIEASSAGLGKGSEFVVRLPVLETSQPQGTETDEPAFQSSLRILVVDDNRDGADSLSMMLRLMGNDTRTAYDGEEAVAAAVEFRPDVILLDIGLPRLTGYEACRRIRRQPGGKELVIIAQTGWGQEEDRQRTHQAGFDHHLVKPVEPTALMKLLAGLQAVKE